MTGNTPQPLVSSTGDLSGIGRAVAMEQTGRDHRPVFGARKLESRSRLEAFVAKTGLALKSGGELRADPLALAHPGGRANARTVRLSGGWQRRVGTIAVPGHWFPGKPHSPIGPLIRCLMQDASLRPQRQLTETVIGITDGIVETFPAVDRIAPMRGGQTIQTGAPAGTGHSPADDYVANFMADMSLSPSIRRRDPATVQAGIGQS